MASSTNDDAVTATRMSINGDLPTSSCDEEGSYLPDDMLSPFGPPINEGLTSRAPSRVASLTSSIKAGPYCMEGFNKVWLKIRYFVVPIELLSFLVVFAMTFSIQLVQQFQYQSMVAKETGSNDSSGCLNDTGSYLRTVNHYRVAFIIVYLVPAVILTLFIGSISDRYGRKPLLCLTVAGNLFIPILGLITVYLDTDTRFMFIGGFAAGLSGGLCAVLALLYSYVSDITPTSWLTIRMGTLEASILLGGGSSVAIADAVIKSLDCNFEKPMWILFSICVVSLLYCLVLPESLQLAKPSNESTSSSKKGALKCLIEGFRLLFWKSEISKRLFETWLIIIVLLISFTNTFGLTQLNLHLLRNKPLEWSYGTIGIYHVTSSIAHFAVLAVILPVLVIVQMADIAISFVGILGACGGAIFVAELNHSWEMFLAGIVLGFEVLVMPGLRTRITTIVSGNSIGGVFSIVAALQMSLFIVISVIFHEVYSPGGIYHVPAHSGLLHQTLYWVVTGLWVVASVIIIVIFFVKRNLKEEKKLFFYNTNMFVRNSYGAIVPSSTSK